MADVLSSLSNIFGGSIATGIADIIRLFKVDPNVALQHQAELEKIQADLQGKMVDAASSMATAQNAVNEAEAKSGNFFVAAWRPLIGYCCGAGLFVQFLVSPIVTWVAALCGHPVAFPTLDMGTLLTLLLGMLGLGGMRTYEKVNGVTDEKNPK